MPETLYSLMPVKSYSGLQTFAMESKLTSFVAWRSDSVSPAFPKHSVGLR